MQRVCIGKRNKTDKCENIADHTAHGTWLTVFGLAAMAVFLAGAIAGENAENVKNSGEAAVPVMAVSSVNADREELQMPDRKTYAEGETSVFDEIGSFFASLLFGEA
ncbi:MAG: hypothetical protein IJC71_02535 [Clostridia bacterium]|nr:hypothetical protein [Clostridia bacterium]